MVAFGDLLGLSWGGQIQTPLHINSQSVKKVKIYCYICIGFKWAKDLSNNVNNASETCKAVMSSAKGAEMEGDLMDIKMTINKILNDINSANNPNELGKGLNNLVSEGQKVFGEYEKASSYASNDGAKKAMAMGCNELNKQLEKFKEDTSKETNPEILKT